MYLTSGDDVIVVYVRARAIFHYQPHLGKFLSYFYIFLQKNEREISGVLYLAQQNNSITSHI